MNITIDELFKREDLYGEFLLQPLKKYHGFFVTKINGSSGLTHTSLKIIHVASAIFAYPIFGMFAGFGIAAKLANIYIKSNSSDKSSVSAATIATSLLPAASSVIPSVPVATSEQGSLLAKLPTKNEPAIAASTVQIVASAASPNGTAVTAPISSVTPVRSCTSTKPLPLKICIRDVNLEQIDEITAFKIKRQFEMIGVELNQAHNGSPDIEFMVINGGTDRAFECVLQYKETIREIQRSMRKSVSLIVITVKNIENIEAWFFNTKFQFQTEWDKENERSQDPVGPLYLAPLLNEHLFKPLSEAMTNQLKEDYSKVKGDQKKISDFIVKMFKANAQAQF